MAAVAKRMTDRGHSTPPRAPSPWEVRAQAVFGGGLHVVFRSLNDLYSFSRVYSAELKILGHLKLADDLDRALTGGTTSGEILTWLAVSFRAVESEGLGDKRTEEAVAYMATLANNQRGSRS